MTRPPEQVLVIGFGNPGRRDDGLGPAFAATFEDRIVPGLRVDSGYQLSLEDAAVIAEHDIVIFVDAAAAGPEPFSFRRVRPKPYMSFSSHSVEPETLVAIAEELFQSRAQAFVLGIRGYEFDEFGESLSDKASHNLSAAARFFETCLRERSFRELVIEEIGQWPPKGDPRQPQEEICKTENS